MATLTSRKASNWVDRGEPAEPTLARLLAHYFARHAEDDREWLAAQATIIRGMVEADASEVQVAAYLRHLGRTLALPGGAPPGARLVAIALWHAAKAALVRDVAERVLRGEIPPNDPTPESLASWLVPRLLSPEEFAAYQAEVRRGDESREAEP
jgi:hypothetical protein